MKPRLGLRMVMLIVAGCAVILAIARSDWATEWGGYLLVVSVVGPIAGALCTLPSVFLFWTVVRSAPWLRRETRDPRTEPHFWVWVWDRTSRRAIRLPASWRSLGKQAFWSCCAALGLVFLLDQVSGGNWWKEGAPGEIGWRAYAVLSAGVIFAVCAA